MLRNAGIPDVYLLDGGLAAWRDAGFDVESGERQAEPGDVVLTDGALPVIDAGQASSWGRHGLLLDARAGERYRGEFEPVDPRAGHIPGAVSAPTTANVGADGRFLSPEALRERFTGLGVRADVPTAVYCGSGVTAAHEIAALEIAGFPAALYPGSFSEWSNNYSNEVVTGAAPYPDGPQLTRAGRDASLIRLGRPLIRTGPHRRGAARSSEVPVNRPPRSTGPFVGSEALGRSIRPDSSLMRPEALPVVRV